MSEPLKTLEHKQGTRIALFGGSFDPPHLGHLAVACAARDALQLDRVLFAPVGAQPLKPEGPTASFSDRLAMTRLAIAGERALEVSLVDAPKSASAPNYTFDSLVQLRSGLAKNDELFCLMGADSLLNFRQWHRSAEIPFIAPLIVVSRPGQSLADLESAVPSGLSFDSATSRTTVPSGRAEVHSGLLRNISDDTSILYLLSGVEVDISATHVREWLRKIESTGNPSPQGPSPLSPLVLDYIESHNLYR